MYIRVCVFIEEEQIGYERTVSVLLLTPVYMHGVIVCFLLLSFAPYVSMLLPNFYTYMCIFSLA
jgi:hypothetical protein